MKFCIHNIRFSTYLRNGRKFVLIDKNTSCDCLNAIFISSGGNNGNDKIFATCRLISSFFNSSTKSMNIEYVNYKQDEFQINRKKKSQQLSNSNQFSKYKKIIYENEEVHFLLRTKYLANTIKAHLSVEL